MVPLNHYLVLSAILFAIGTAGVFLRRNLITMLLSIEIMLNAVNLTFVAVGRYLGTRRRADHRVLRHDRGGGRGGGRPGARHRAVPAPRDAQPRRVHGVEMVDADAAADSAASVPRVPGQRRSRAAAAEARVRRRRLRGDDRRRSRVVGRRRSGCWRSAGRGARDRRRRSSPGSPSGDFQVPLRAPARSAVVADDPGRHRHRLADPHLLDRLHARGDATASTRATSRT